MQLIENVFIDSTVEQIYCFGGVGMLKTNYRNPQQLVHSFVSRSKVLRRFRYTDNENVISYALLYCDIYLDYRLFFPWTMYSKFSSVTRLGTLLSYRLHLSIHLNAQRNGSLFQLKHAFYLLWYTIAQSNLIFLCNLLSEQHV